MFTTFITLFTLANTLTLPDFSLVNSHTTAFEYDNDDINPNDSGSFTFDKWSCPIPYKIDAGLIEPTRVIIAIQHITENTGWTFTPQTTEDDYINFIDSDGCWSYIGRRGGSQDVGLSEYCDIGAVIHEIVHAIGVHHEQTREDRDSYVNIDFDNIPSNRHHNFAKNTLFNKGDYDYNSIMHYDQFAFAEDNTKKTIIPTNSLSGICHIGQRNELSLLDIEHVNSLFKNDAKCSNNQKQTVCYDLVICGAYSNTNAWSLLFGQFYVNGTLNGEKFYYSKWQFRNHRVYVYWDNYEHWLIQYDGGTYALLRNRNLFANGWQVFDFGTRNYEEDNLFLVSQPSCTTKTQKPTNSPTTSPTLSPSHSPTTSPSRNPSTSPSYSPTTSPSRNPSTSPTLSSTKSPTTSPTLKPTFSPTLSSTNKPSKSEFEKLRENNLFYVVIGLIVAALIFIGVIIFLLLRR
jgi:hypothetical protein